MKIKALERDLLKNIENDLNFFDRTTAEILKKYTIKIYRKGMIDEFNIINKS